MAKIEISLVRGKQGCSKRQIANLDALGLKKVNKKVMHEDSPQILGMIKKVEHPVNVKKANELLKDKNV